ncbi:MAG: hypothetical protein FKY71_13875 [Spiribacter salinus]|uniref:Uncharacterized protein n=1 Tax=Spiribacter salinus TaxID=1335746 RepID=A0A540VNV9_9GAMM|nr:MAG: hypothetical protein FKY71_13875 [Spiribacter salinus]
MGADGKQQIEAMARLAGDQWKPDTLAGFQIGDCVRLPNLDCPLEVIDLCPPSLLVLRAPSGHELRAGWRAVTRVRTRAEIASGDRR